MAAFTVAASDENVPLALAVNDVDGGVEGLSPIVQLRLASDPTLFLDFADDIFKTSGWTLKEAPLTEIGNGQYQRTMSLPDLIAAGLNAADTFIAEYRVDESGFALEGQDIIVIGRAFDGAVNASGQLPGGAG